MFIGNVLKFFNYGDRFIRMVATILSSRKGKILMEDGLSGTFNIERGTPQGDKASPYLFILCIEILLIKKKQRRGKALGFVCSMNGSVLNTILKVCYQKRMQMT